MTMNIVTAVVSKAGFNNTLYLENQLIVHSGNETMKIVLNMKEQKIYQQQEHYLKVKKNDEPNVLEVIT